MNECNINEIFSKMKEFPSEKDRKLIEKAYAFAEKAHKGQLRNSGEPYFVHVFNVGKLLANYGMDAEIISAGLIHDTIEDTSVTEADIEREFGKDILFLVNRVTKLGKLKYRGEERHVESLKKFFMAVASDFRVLMIKLADRLHNLRTLEHVRPEKQKRIALESIEVYAPLANRLGIGRLKGEIEDAAFPFAYPKEAEMVEKILKEKFVASQAHLEQVEKILLSELDKNNIKLFKIDHRLKHHYSLWRKLQKYNMDIEKIYDIMALRVTVNSIEDCYRVLGLIHMIWKPLPGRIKDYIALPKTNGYQAIHTTIFSGDGGIVEIQIRTIEMHNRAEYGIASHARYKDKTLSAKTAVDEHFVWSEKLRELEHTTVNDDNFLDSLKEDFFTNRIFIFTPKGAVIDLPEDSSPIDFAYMIHTQIGNTCASAKVNGKIAPLSTKLKSGDIVEIITNKNTKPASKWLEYVKTNMAKKHINAHLKENSLLSRFLSFGSGK